LFAYELATARMKINNALVKYRSFTLFSSLICLVSSN
jgi:hypothetical protein